MKKRENLSFCALWSRIKVVVMRRTRNAFVLRGTRVRIPPTPLVLCFGSACWQGLFYFFSDWFPAGIAFRRPLRLSAKNCSFRFLCGYCFLAAVTSIREELFIPIPLRVLLFGGRYVYPRRIVHSDSSAGIAFRRPLRLSANLLFYRLNCNVVFLEHVTPECFISSISVAHSCQLY